VVDRRSASETGAAETSEESHRPVRLLHGSDAEAARETAVLLARRWVPGILVSLQAGPLRRSELAAQLGSVSEKVLTETLRALEVQGAIGRKVHSDVPPAVTYRITSGGRVLLDLVERLAGWSADGQPTGSDSRLSQLGPNATGGNLASCSVEP
jgi:DNA-binding HxlR family transcriptional regulator